MADIWSEIGVDLGKAEGDWLYRLDGEIHGPVAHAALVEKLLRGEIDVQTPVAREATDFHPLGMVKAFAPHLEAAKRATQTRHQQKQRRLALIFVLVALGLGAVGAGTGRFLYLRAKDIELEQARKLALQTALMRKTLEAEAEVRRKAYANTPTLPLVALVSLGKREEITIHGKNAAGIAAAHLAARHGTPAKTGPSEASAEPEAADEVQGCNLSQTQVFVTLQGSLGRINVCVEDEKKRDTDGLLPPTLILQFVVKPSGKATEFAIDDRHFRTGPLHNCLTKAFNMMSFPQSTGANCPISIPIKIGK